MLLCGMANEYGSRQRFVSNFSNLDSVYKSISSRYKRMFITLLKLNAAAASITLMESPKSPL